MTRRVNCVLVVLALTLAIAPRERDGLARAAAAEADGDKKDVDFQQTPEAKVLDQYLGKWHCEANVLVPEKTTRLTEIETSWVGKGHWQKTSFHPADGRDGLYMMTYDSAEKSYLAYTFESSGKLYTYHGTWNAAARTFTWTRRDPDGGGVLNTDHFVDADTVEVTWKEFDGAGKTTYQSVEKQRRIGK